MTVKEMQEDIMQRYYESNIELLKSGKLTESERVSVLHDAAVVFNLCCEKIGGKECT